MGTNYYLFTKNKNLVKNDLMEKAKNGIYHEEYVLVDEPDFGYTIHLNKCSCGWRPLFQCHNMFKIFSELEAFYHAHRNDFIILDEYNTEYTWDEYKALIIDHGNVQKTPQKWTYSPTPVTGSKPYLHTERCTPEEAEIWAPFNHLEYQKSFKEAAMREHCYDLIQYGTDEKFYSHVDPEYPIDWAVEEFC